MMFTSNTWDKFLSGVTTAIPPVDVPRDISWEMVILAIYFPVIMYQYMKLGKYLFTRLFQRRAASNFEEIPLLPESTSSNTKRYTFKTPKPESVKIGSDPFTADWPKCQMLVWSKDDNGQYFKSGNAWRFADYVVTASHCLEGNEIALSMPDQDVAVLEFTKVYDYDEIAILTIPPQFFSDYNVKSAKITGNLDGMVRVTGCGVTKSTTSGILSPTDTFGIYKYSGTTKPGYSGAPYLVGDTQVVAMHLFGGDAGNLCVQATYIKMLIERMVGPAKKQKKPAYRKISEPKTTNPEPEAKGKQRKKGSKKRKNKSDWYLEDINPGDKIRVRRSRRDPEEYEFELGGHYYTVDESGYKQLRATAQSRGAAVIFDSSVDRGRDDYDYDYYDENIKQSDHTDTDSNNDTDNESDFLDSPNDGCKMLRDMGLRSATSSNPYLEQQKLVQSMQEFTETLVNSMQSNVSRIITQQTSLLLESLGKPNSIALGTMPKPATNLSKSQEK